jgi:hypothetical protein
VCPNILRVESFFAQGTGDEPSCCALSSEDEQTPPCLNLAVALPLGVWQEHLTPWLSLVEAAWLRKVCKALKGLMDECPVGLGSLRADKLKAALTCFPAAQSLEIAIDKEIPAADEGALVELLRQHGRTLKRVVPHGEDAMRLVSSAVRAGALPKLSFFITNLADPVQRQLLAERRLTTVEEMWCGVLADHDAEEVLAALKNTRRLPHLRILYIALLFKDTLCPATVPPFVPHSLKTLGLRITSVDWLELLLRDLPRMLRKSGAGLEDWKLWLTDGISVECGAALARILHTCSSTLKVLEMVDGDKSEGAPRLAFASRWRQAW